MASRFAFYVRNQAVRKSEFEFDWAPGLSAAQKKKSMRNLHAAIGAKTLEVSTKGDEELGVRLSAFNLTLGGIHVENIYQSSKLFEHGGPYTDLLAVSPKEAKRDERLRNSGDLVCFEWNGERFDRATGSAFYDYVYCRAVRENFTAEELKPMLDYAYFTDIEFNPNKARNTQARSAAIVKLFLELYGEIPELNAEEFRLFHARFVKG